jgi:mono/diheme cytochrome c family protein
VSYVWNDQGTDAVLAPAVGVVLDTPSAPTGRYEVPSKADCLACHEGAAAPVLGASAVQLSRVRDAPRLPEARSEEPAPEVAMVDVKALIARGLLRNFPQSWQRSVPGIAAVTETEREALGYLHGNCGHCHNHDGAPAALGLVLAQSAEEPEASRRRVLHSTVNARSRYRPPRMTRDPVVIAPGHPEASVIEWRMRSRHALVQMPPLGTLVRDDEGISLIRRWIASDLLAHKEPPR